MNASEDCNDVAINDRRSFLANCGKLAVTVPPAMTLLMSTSMASAAIAKSSGAPGEGGPGGDTGSGGSGGEGGPRHG